MSEQVNVAIPDRLSPVADNENSPPARARSNEQRRALLIKRIVLIGSILSAGVTALYVLLYFQTGAWQTLAIAGFAILAIICLAMTGRAARRGNLDVAGYWILITTVVAYGGGELVMANATLYITASSIAIILLAGNAALPRKRGTWLATAAAYGAYVWFINRFEPVPRYDVGQMAIPRIATAGITVLFALGVAWQIIRVMRIGTIRVRLLVAFVSVVALLGIVISVSVLVGGLQLGQQRTISQLESVATLKEIEINNWVNNLRAGLGTTLIGEDTAWRLQILLQQSPDIPVFRKDAHDRLQMQLKEIAGQLQWFEEVFLLDLHGQVILSTDPEQEGKNYSNQLFFQDGLEEPNVTPSFYSVWPQSQMVVVVTRPIVNNRGRTLGVLAGRANMALLNEMMLERTGLGETGETYLVNSNQTWLTELRFSTKAEASEIYLDTQGVDAALEGHVNGSGLYDGYRGTPVIGVYRWLPTLQLALLAEQDQAEAYRLTYTMLSVIGGVALVAVLLAVVASLAITQSIANPLSNLSETARQIAAGNLDLVAKVEREDELGAMARAFNSMTQQLHGHISNLEHRVAARTHELERRAIYLQAAAEVGHAAAAIHRLDELLPQVAHLIGERFGFYHIGIFLLDEASQYAVLRAANSEGGQQMLAQGHRLKVGEQGIVGYVTSTGKPRVALDVGKDAVHFQNPFLPHTRSEMALPLAAGGRLFGALDVQSTQQSAFTQQDVAALQVLADQVAVALENARLFAEHETALEATRRAYAELSREAWSEVIRSRSTLGFRSSDSGITTTTEEWHPEMEEALQQGKTIQDNGADPDANVPIAVPIKVRDQIIGVLDTYKPGGTGRWTPEEIAFLETMTEQLGVTLESARLFEETIEERDHTSLLLEASQQLSADLEFAALINTVLSLAPRLGAEAAELYITDVEKETYFFKSTLPERATLTSEEATAFSKLILNEGLEGKVLRERQPVLIADTKLDDRWLILPGHEEVDPVRSVISVPLVAGRGTIQGVLSITQRSPNAFDEDDLNLAMSLASQAAVALDNTNLFETTQTALEETSMLYRASRAIGSATTIPDLASALLTSLPGSNFDRSLVLIRRQEDDMLEVVTGWDRDGHPWQSGLVINASRIQQDLAIYNDLPNNDALSKEQYQQMLGTEGLSLASVPILFRSRLLGIWLLESRRISQLTDSILQSFVALATQAGVAIENRRLFEETHRAAKEEALLNEMLRDMATALDVEMVIRTVHDSLVQLIPFNHMSVAMLNNETSVLEVIHGRYEQPVDEPDTLNTPQMLPQRETLMGHAVDLRQSLIFDLADQTLQGLEVEPLQQAGIESLVILPLVYGHNILGVLTLGHNYRNAYTTTDLPLLERVAQLMTVALENARLFSQVSQRAIQLQTAAEVSRAATSILRLDDMLPQAVELIRDRFDLYYVGTFLVDDSAEWAILKAGTGEAGKLQIQQGHKLKVGDKSMIGWCVANSRARVALDVGKEAVHFDNPFLPDTRSEMAIPLTSWGTTIGALTVQSTLPAAFGHEETLTLQTMADQLANAIQNARLYEEVQTAYADTKEERDRLELLHDTMIAIEQATTIEHKLTLVADGLQQVGYGRVALTLRDNQLKATHLTTAGMSKDEEAWLWENMTPADVWRQRLSAQFDRFRIGRCYYLPWLDPEVPSLVGQVLPSQQSPETLDPNRWHPNDLLYVPMYDSANRLTGIISLDDPVDGQPPTQDSLRIIELFAQEAALALENAQLLHQAQQRARREALIREITGKIRASTDLETILQTTVKEVARALETPQGAIRLGTAGPEPNRPPQYLQDQLTNKDREEVDEKLKALHTTTPSENGGDDPLPPSEQVPPPTPEVAGKGGRDNE